MGLPDLNSGESPIRHSDCCLAISTKLLRLLTEYSSVTAPRDHTSTILSIGSGTGLLEALWLAYLADDSFNKLSVEGVEVHSVITRESVNKYLPEQAFTTVHGTWGLTPRLGDSEVTALLFVYPRQPKLVSDYIQACAREHPSIKTIIWLGPNADWAVFEPCFDTSRGEGSSSFSIVTRMEGEDAGIDSYEMMVVLKRAA